MAHKGADYKGERGINHTGIPATFPEEEDHRGRLPGKALVTPRPQFVQPDNGAHTSGAHAPLDIMYPVTSQRMKSGNVETDLNGGLY